MCIPFRSLLSAAGFVCDRLAKVEDLTGSHIPAWSWIDVVRHMISGCWSIPIHKPQLLEKTLEMKLTFCELATRIEVESSIGATSWDWYLNRSTPLGWGHLNKVRCVLLDARILARRQSAGLLHWKRCMGTSQAMFVHVGVLNGNRRAGHTSVSWQLYYQYSWVVVGDIAGSLVAPRVCWQVSPETFWKQVIVSIGNPTLFFVIRSSYLLIFHHISPPLWSHVCFWLRYCQRPGCVSMRELPAMALRPVDPQEVDPFLAIHWGNVRF